jgi:carboxyl-terminal processing protease
MTFPNIRFPFRFLLLLLGCLAVGPIMAQEKPESQPGINHQQRQRNVDSFDLVWKTVRDQYWDPNLAGLNWEELKDEFRPKVEAATTNEQARSIARELLDQLKVSHFGIIPADAYEKLDADKPRGSHTTGLDVRIVDDQVLVTEVRNGSPADKLGIKTGWQIIQIGETDITARYEKISDELADHPHRRTILVSAVQGKLLGRSGETIDIVFLDGDDKEIKLTIPLAEPRGKKANFGHIPEFHVWIEIKNLKENIGYIRFNAFMDPAYLMPQFNEAMVDFKDADGIIIDVRGNGGGLGEMATAMMGWLLPDGRQQMGTVIMRETKLKMLVHPRANPYPGRVVVLTDEMSISAAEFFASGMNDLELARLIGTRTAGAVLGSMIEKLPNGDGFQYPRANYISKTTGKPLEGVGVLPHQEVKHQRKALLQGRDLQLEAAIQWIEKKH